MSSSDSSYAESAKQRGNAFYIKSQFGEALKAYQEACKSEPKNPTYHANQSAVYFETGLYNECIDSCIHALQLLDGQDAAGLGKRLKLRMAKSHLLSGHFSKVIELLQNPTEPHFEEYNALIKSAEMHLNHHSKCNSPEQPLACGVSVPSVKGSLQPFFEPFQYPISTEIPISLLNASSTKREYPYYLDKTYFDSLKHDSNASVESESLNLLFAHSSDPRHILETLFDLNNQLLSGNGTTNDIRDSTIPETMFFVLDPSNKNLARQVLILYVLGHPDLDHNRRVMASQFTYFLWLANNLIPPHWTMLFSTLEELVKLSFNLETWRHDPRSNWITFSSERDLKLVREAWISWGAWMETNKEKPRKHETALQTRVELLTSSKSLPIQKLHSIDSKIKGSLYESSSPMIKREDQFFEVHKLILPPPQLLEGDISLPPKSIKDWKFNPTFEVSSLSGDNKVTKWIPAVSNDGIWPRSSQLHKQYVDALLKSNSSVSKSNSSLSKSNSSLSKSNSSLSKSNTAQKTKNEQQQSVQHPGHTMTTSIHLHTMSSILRKWIESKKITFQFACADFADLNDSGSRIGSIVNENKIKFDRIYTSNLCDAIGLLQVVVNSMLMLKQNAKHAAFFTCFGMASAASYNNMVKMINSQLRFESFDMMQRLMGLSVDGTPNTHLKWIIKSNDCSNPSIEQKIAIVESMPISNNIKKWICDIFVMITYPVAGRTRGDIEQIVEPGSSNLNTFIRILELLLKFGVPKHVITTTLENILSGSIEAYIAEASLEEVNSSSKRSTFNTSPYLMELRILLSIASGPLLNQCGLVSENALQDITDCHWYQNEKFSLPNFPPVRMFPSNPSLCLILVNNTRIDTTDNIRIVDKFVKLEGRKQLLSLLSRYSDDIHVISCLYWNAPPRIDVESSTSFGCWLPKSYFNSLKSPSQISTILIRYDLYRCAGVSTLASMSATTD